MKTEGWGHIRLKRCPPDLKKGVETGKTFKRKLQRGEGGTLVKGVLSGRRTKYTRWGVGAKSGAPTYPDPRGIKKQGKTKWRSKNERVRKNMDPR